MGRYMGEIGEIKGRYRGDVGRLLAHEAVEQRRPLLVRGRVGMRVRVRVRR